jgi:pilus assembly protein Flp/PilA
MSIGGRPRHNGEAGASAVDYAILVGLIAVAIVGTVGLLGASLSPPFARVTVGLTGTTTGEGDAGGGSPEELDDDDGGDDGDEPVQPEPPSGPPGQGGGNRPPTPPGQNKGR